MEDGNTMLGVSYEEVNLIAGAAATSYEVRGPDELQYVRVTAQRTGHRADKTRYERGCSITNEQRRG